MQTRDEIKAHYYKIFLDEELSRLDTVTRFIGTKPTIETTASYVRIDSTDIPDNATSRVFRESRFYMAQIFLLLAVPAVALIAFIFQVGKERPLWLNLLAALLMLLAAVISWKITMRREGHRRLEIAATGISIGDKHFPWKKIVGTIMLRRIGKTETYKLVLLLDNGEIIRHNLEYYESFSFRTRENICVAIEHFKSKVPGW